jgi:hypothetical protein
VGEREPTKEHISRGELYFLSHPGGEEIYSGYGLTLREGEKALLVGLLMVDRPKPADPKWLERVEETFGEYRLVPMTTTGERGIICRMQVDPESLSFLRQFRSRKTNAIRKALKPLIENPPNPVFALQWDEEDRLWKSQIVTPNELPVKIRELFECFGYGCLAIEADLGIVHACHAADTDIDGFADKPVKSLWQLIKMPTAPLIRLELLIFDQPGSPYKFESFLNVAEDSQVEVLAQLANQDQLYLAFYGDDLNYRYTKIIRHGQQQWQQLDELVSIAERYWSKIPSGKRDYDRAKVNFMRRFT